MQEGRHRARLPHPARRPWCGDEEQDVAQLLADLAVTKTHSRPHVSNDNPFSESQFKTMKYRPEFPDRFGSQEHGLSFCRSYFDWYNTRHHHSGLGFLTPAQVHHGLLDGALAHRQSVLSRAYATHPERFPHGIPRVARPAVRCGSTRPCATCSAATRVRSAPTSPPGTSPRARVEPLVSPSFNS